MPLESITRIAEFTGKAKETVSKVVKAAGLKSVAGGKTGRAHLYESRDVVPLLFDALDPDQLDLSKERARLAHHQANKVSLEEDTLRGKLVPVEEVKRNWCEMVAAARAKLLALPQRIAQVAVGGSSIREVEESARKEIYDALRELGGGAQPGGEGVDSPAAPDDSAVGRGKKGAQSRGKRGARKVAKPKGATHRRADGGAKS